MKLDFTHAKDHLELGMPVTVDGQKGKIVAISDQQIDVETEATDLTIVNHYNSDFVGAFEIGTKHNHLIKDQKELKRRVGIAGMRRDQLIDILLDEIEELRGRIITLEKGLI